GAGRQRCPAAGPRRGRRAGSRRRRPRRCLRGRPPHRAGRDRRRGRALRRAHHAHGAGRVRGRRVTGLLQLFVALAVTLGLLALGVALLKRLPSLTGGKTGALEVLQRLPLGPRQGIALVRVGERVLVVGMADHDVRLLTELPREEWAAAAAAAPPRAGETPNAPRFALRIPGLGRIGALLLVALLVAPQAFAQNASGGAATAATKSTPRAAASAPA